MKNIVIASIIAIASTTAASAYTCQNNVEIVDGEYVYTSSICTNQPPASQIVLDIMSYAANNPGNDDQQIEEEVVEVVVAGVVTVVPVADLSSKQKEIYLGYTTNGDASSNRIRLAVKTSTDSEGNVTKNIEESL